MNEKPCVACGVPEAEHTTAWNAHNYTPPVDDSEREEISEEGFRDVLAGKGTVSEVAARESEGGAASFGSGGASFLDRFNSLVVRAELAVQAFGDLISRTVKQQTTTTTQPVPEPEPEPAPASSDIPTTVEHGVNQTAQSEEPPSNPE